MIHAGVSLSREIKSTCPLMYIWYGELYTGAAHGHAGILYILIKVTNFSLYVEGRAGSTEFGQQTTTRLPQLSAVVHMA